MFIITLLITILTQSTMGQLKNLDHLVDWSVMTPNESEYFILNENLKEQDFLIEQFQSVKIQILKGKINIALKKLDELMIKYEDESVRRVITFLKAKCYFIIGDFNQSLKLLDNSLFVQNIYYEDTCYLEYLSSINVDVEKSILGINRCIRLNDQEYNVESNWLTYINDHIEDKNLENDYFKNLLLKAKQFTSYKDVESWLKFGLYFNYEDLIVKSLGSLPSIAILNDELRTLVAYNLYNSGKIEQAKEYIEDIENANAFYLKSIIALNEKNYQVAGAHILTTIKTKGFAINANQIALANLWLTKDFKNARYSLNKLIPLKGYKIYQYILNTTLVYKERKLFRAEKEIDFLNLAYAENLPFEGSILATNIYLNNSNKKWIESSENACKSFDPLNCWLRIQSDIWEDFSKHYISKTTEEWSFRYNEEFNKLFNNESEKFEDSIFINQADIEELDILDDPKMGEIKY